MPNGNRMGASLESSHPSGVYIGKTDPIEDFPVRARAKVL
jgi:hypothetical protein